MKVSFSQKAFCCVPSKHLHHTPSKSDFVTLVSPAFEFHINRILQYGYFCPAPFFLKMYLRSNQVVACVSSWVSIASCTPVCHSSNKLDGSWGCFGLRLWHTSLHPASSTQRRQWQPTPILLPGKSHGRRSLVGWLRRVRHNWSTSLSLFTFMHWKRKRQPTPLFLPGESQGWKSLVGCHLWHLTESDTTEET